MLIHCNEANVERCSPTYQMESKLSLLDQLKIQISHILTSCQFTSLKIIIKPNWSLLLYIYISDRTVVRLQLLARNDVIILVMRGLDNFSGDFVRVAACPYGKTDLFQEELRPAQEKR